MRLSGRGLRCVRGGREVFSGLDFDATAGEALAIVGPNGAGKTSLLRLIGGLLALEGGSVTLDGGDAELTLSEQAHYLGHEDAMKPALTVTENLTFWAEFLGGDAADPAMCIDAVGLSHAAALPAGFLSAGQRRRLSIARLLTVRRPIWLLDEPTAALDLGSQRIFAGLMTTHLESGGLIIAATHAPLGIKTRELRIGDGGRMYPTNAPS
ncbi:heme ABC exporter ATP-binding protein CcmA [Tardiphaga sp.]|uniref:heme ABC exporter ATP-binding protein CcmA n=1 Tax=Tardiphaga sp. TaxID=1926292 RepID=UPI0025DBA2B3|nr:heme ABC exporter ATP-binding protein CcmA [Tardiphaga sp.]